VIICKHGYGLLQPINENCRRHAGSETAPEDVHFHWGGIPRVVREGYFVDFGRFVVLGQQGGGRSERYKQRNR